MKLNPPLACRKRTAFIGSFGICETNESNNVLKMCLRASPEAVLSQIGSKIESLVYTER